MKINIRLTPNAKKTELLSEETNLFGEKFLRIKVNAPPVEGKANKELIRFLSEHFHTAKSNIKILQGETSRDKIVEIT